MSTNLEREVFIGERPTQSIAKGYTMEKYDVMRRFELIR